MTLATQNLFAAVAAIALSSAVFAATIIPASPTLFA